jgi:hypothetical protein
VARGWESKAVESQMEEAERRKGAARRGPTTAAAQERIERQRTLDLTRARIRADLAASKVPAHRQMLERALEDIERQIAELREPPDTSAETPKPQSG